MTGQFWLTDKQVERLKSHFPKPRGKPRVDDRRVLSGIFHILRNGLRWQDAPSVCGPHDTGRSTTGSSGGRGWASLPGSSVTWPSRALRATHL